jgi:hypothetical protein
LTRLRPSLNDQQRIDLAAASLLTAGDHLRTFDLVKTDQIIPSALFVNVAWEEWLKAIY